MIILRDSNVHGFVAKKSEFSSCLCGTGPKIWVGTENHRNHVSKTGARPINGVHASILASHPKSPVGLSRRGTFSNLHNPFCPHRPFSAMHKDSTGIGSPRGREGGKRSYWSSCICEMRSFEMISFQMISNKIFENFCNFLQYVFFAFGIDWQRAPWWRGAPKDSTGAGGWWGTAGGRGRATGPGAQIQERKYTIHMADGQLSEIKNALIVFGSEKNCNTLFYSQNNV